MEEVSKEEYIQQLEEAYKKESDYNKALTQTDSSMFTSLTEDNLIRWQLDLKEDLDRIYHLLKGHQVKEDDDGNIRYVDPPDDALKPFNEFGVQIIMNIMSFYLNRNTLLSNYDEKTINWKVLDIGRKIKDLIFNRYEEMGMDTPAKMKMYPMIVQELVDTIHSAYLRALGGGERDSLRTARHVAQTENPFTNSVNYGAPQPQRKFSLLKPRTWKG